MSREIKFRAWDGFRMVYDGDKYYPDHFDGKLKKVTGPSVITHLGIQHWIHETNLPDAGPHHFDHHQIRAVESIMQYTGLKDADGVEIYEGDIVEFTYWWFDGNAAESTLTGEVVYLPDCMSYGLKGVKNKEWIRHIGGKEGDTDTAAFAVWLFDEADFRVIGNIHQNPELLK